MELTSEEPDDNFNDFEPVYDNTRYGDGYMPATMSLKNMNLSRLLQTYHFKHKLSLGGSLCSSCDYKLHTTHQMLHSLAYFPHCFINLSSHFADLVKVFTKSRYKAKQYFIDWQGRLYSLYHLQEMFLIRGLRQETCNKVSFGSRRGACNSVLLK